MSEKASNQIKTTGQLREFISTMIVGVKNGVVDPDRAGRITKLCAQINESFYSEIKVARVRAESGETMGKLGAMPIGENLAD